MLYSRIEGQGKPLLIIHGFLGMSDNWKSFGSLYATEGFQSHMLDLRNHGRSFHSEDFSYEVMAQDVLEYCQEHNLEKTSLIGHSMGGLLARDFILNHDDTWQELKDSKGFRMLFLGSPLGGSFRIPSVLFGEDAIIIKLSKLDLFHTKENLLKMFSQFPGLLALLPLNTDPKNDFANMETWQNMRNYFGKSDWPLPLQSDLDFFKSYRDTILKNIIVR